MEELLHKLCLLDGKTVSLVRPGLGTVSDAFTGDFSADTRVWPVEFELSTTGQTTLFTVKDVKKLENLIIWLKSSSEY